MECALCKKHGYYHQYERLYGNEWVACHICGHMGCMSPFDPLDH